MTKVNVNVNVEPTLEDAQREVAEAEERATRARQLVERKAQEAEQRRAAALREWDERAVAELDYPGLTADIKEAREAFEAAILADPVYAAGVRYIAAMRRRMMLQEEQLLIRKRLGRLPHDAPSVVERPRLEVKSFPDEITRILDVAVNNDWADEADARDLERQEAGEKAARGEGT